MAVESSVVAVSGRLVVAVMMITMVVLVVEIKSTSVFIALAHLSFCSDCMGCRQLVIQRSRCRAFVLYALHVVATDSNVAWKRSATSSAAYQTGERTLGFDPRKNCTKILLGTTVH